MNANERIRSHVKKIEAENLQLKGNLRSKDEYIERYETEIQTLKDRIKELENPWVSVKEKLPRKGQVVDVLYMGKRETNYIYIKDYNGKKGNNFFDPVRGGYCCLRDVKFYIQHPKPPTKEKE